MDRLVFVRSEKTNNGITSLLVISPHGILLRVFINPTLFYLALNILI